MLEYDIIYILVIDINKTSFSKECVSIKGNDYRIHFWCLGKDDAISIMNNSSLNEKTGVFYL